MSNANDRILLLAAKIADGSRIDWSSFEHPCDPDSDVEETDPALIDALKTLSRLQQISSTHFYQKDAPQPASESASTPLGQWGHLSIIEALGSGNFGQVYRAYDPTLDRDVALKLSKLDQRSMRADRAFLDEARRMAQVRHPNVLAVHGAAVVDGQAGLWTDLIIGSDLSHIDRQYDQAELLNILITLASALDAVHQTSQVHGDVKPANIMRDLQGKLTLMDFGAGSDISHDSSGLMHSIGTPALMAPERLEDSTALPPADIYSLAMTVFRLASGRYRVQAETIPILIEQHRQKNYLMLSDLRSDLSPDLTRLIESMLDPNPEHRPDASAVVSEARLIESAPARRKHRRRVTMIITALVLTSVISATGFYMANQARQLAEREQATTQTINDFLQDMFSVSPLLQSGRDARVADLLDSAAVRVSDRFDRHPDIRASLSLSISRSYTALGMNKEAATLLQHALNEQMDRSQISDELRLEMLLALAFSEIRLDQLSHASTLIDQIDLESSTQLRSNHPVMLQSKFTRALLLVRREQFEEAERLFNDLLKQLPESPSGYRNLRARTYEQLADLATERGDFQSAEFLARQGLQWQQQYASHDLYNTEAMRTTLAVALLRQGRHDEALELMDSISPNIERMLGDESLEYLGHLINQAGILQEQGQADKSLALLDLAATHPVLLNNPDHPYTVVLANTRANSLSTAGRIDEAERLMRETLPRAQGLLGEHNEVTLFLQYNLVELLNNQQRFEDSLDLARQNLANMTHQHGEDHAYSLLASVNLGNSLSGSGSHDEALALLRSAQTSLQAALGAAHPYTLAARHDLASCLARSGDLPAALVMIEQVIAGRKVTLGDEHPETQKSIRLQRSLLKRSAAE